MKSVAPMSLMISFSLFLNAAATEMVLLIRNTETATSTPIMTSESTYMT